MWTSLLLLAGALAADPEETFSITVGGPALIFALPSVNEDSAVELVRKPIVTLNELVGVKPTYPSAGVVLYFFERASGEDTLKALNTVARKHRGDKVRMLGICIDETTHDELHGWIDPLKLDYPILADNFRVVAERYGIREVPTVVVVDAAGNVFSVGAPKGADLVSTVESQIGGLLR